jgi:hypothetical protein
MYACADVCLSGGSVVDRVHDCELSVGPRFQQAKVRQVVRRYTEYFLA